MNQPPVSPTNKFVFVALPLACGMSLFGCSTQSVPPAASSPPPTASVPTHTGEHDRDVSKDQLPDWSLSESDSNSLGSPYNVSPFEIRPPATFRFIKYVAEAKTHYWVGPVRADKTYPQLMVTITALSARDTNAPLANLLKDVLSGIQKHRQEWSATPAEHGKINGLSFVRSSWSGVATSAARDGLSGRAMHGVVYLSVYDNQAVQIMCQDVAPDHAEWLKQGSTAAMSFRVAATPSASP